MRRPSGTRGGGTALKKARPASRCICTLRARQVQLQLPGADLEAIGIRTAVELDDTHVGESRRQRHRSGRRRRDRGGKQCLGDALIVPRTLAAGAPFKAAQRQSDRAALLPAFDHAVEGDQLAHIELGTQAAASRFQSVRCSSRLSHMPQPIGLKARASSRRYQAPGRSPGMRSVRL